MATTLPAAARTGPRSLRADAGDRPCNPAVRGRVAARTRAGSVVGRWAAALLVAGWTAGAAAHDTWFELRGTPAAGNLFLALGTGNRYPVFEFPPRAEHLQRHGCRSAGHDVELAPVANGSVSLILRTRLAGTAPASCWAQLHPAEIELKAELIPVYLEEARPPAAVLAHWAALQARGVPWRERYTKHARIVFGSAGDSPALPTAEPQDLGMDMVLLGDGRALREGDLANVQVLRDGRPLAGLAVEWIRQAAAAGASTAAHADPGIWMQTDAQGRVQLTLPAAGRWLLRGIDIRPSETVPDSWDSRFVTLAFDVAAPMPRRLE